MRVHWRMSELPSPGRKHEQRRLSGTLTGQRKEEKVNAHRIVNCKYQHGFIPKSYAEEERKK